MAKKTTIFLNTVDGLTRKTSQTFDENNKMIENTAVTMSNSQQQKLEKLQNNIIDNGITDGFINSSDKAYQDYKDATDILREMNSEYSKSANLSDEQISQWKEQIALVEMLGKEVQDLIEARKQKKQQEIFESDKKKKLSNC
jgi:hypothetical protein